MTTATQRTSHPHKWAILAFVLAAQCMDLLDGTIVNVAAPTIRSDLHATSSALQWMIGGYALAFAVGLITGGRLGDIYGRRRLFVIGAVGFVCASVACAFSQSPEMLIGLRLGQGFMSALLIPQGLGIVRDAFAPAEQASAFAVFGPVIGLSAVLGPILGGALIGADAFGSGWRLIFFVNLPLGLAAAIGAARLFPESRAARRPRLDLIGSALGAGAMGLLVYPLIQGRAAGWPAWTYVMGAGSLVCVAALVIWSRLATRRGRDPLVEPTIFGHRAYTSGLATVLVFFSGMMGSLMVLTLYLQFGEHFTPIHAGITIAPFALGSAVGAVLAATVLVGRLGRTTLQVAALLMAAGFLWLYETFAAHGLRTSTLELIAPQLLVGAGIGMLISPLFDFILASVADHEVGSASGLLEATQQLAGAIGIAVLGTVFFTTLGHSGFVAAIERCLLIQVAATPLLLLLTRALPARARDPQADAPLREASGEALARANV